MTCIQFVPQKLNKSHISHVLPLADLNCTHIKSNSTQRNLHTAYIQSEKHGSTKKAPIQHAKTSDSDRRGPAHALIPLAADLYEFLLCPGAKRMEAYIHHKSKCLII